MENITFDPIKASSKDRAYQIRVVLNEYGIRTMELADKLGITRQAIYMQMHQGISVTKYYGCMKAINDILAAKEREYKRAGTSYMPTVVDDGGYLPERAHATDAGLDLRTPEDFILPANNGRKTIRIKVHTQTPAESFGMVFPKSGLMEKFGIFCAGAVDEGYTGEIGVTLINTGDQDVRFRKGDKIAQLIHPQVIYTRPEQVAELEETERGDGGFGSTGR